MLAYYLKAKNCLCYIISSDLFIILIPLCAVLKSAVENVMSQELMSFATLHTLHSTIWQN